MPEDEQTSVTQATEAPAPPAEAQPPAGQTVAELQAKVTDWETRYSKEIGDRDRGMANQARKLKDLEEQLALAMSGTDALARKIHGEDAPEETEYQRWKREHTRTEIQSTQSRQQTPEHLVATGRMQEAAEDYGIDYRNPPADLMPLTDRVIALYADNPAQAANEWKAGLKKRAADLSAKAKAEADAQAKAQKEEADRKAKLGQRDTSTSTGGAQGSYQAVRDAWIKNPNDPGTRQAYLEARKAKGL